MLTIHKIQIDHLFGGVLARIANMAALLVSRLLHRSHTLPPGYTTIAVCKLKGIGSIVQATAMLQTLKVNFPQCHLIFISTNTNRELLERIPVIDSVIILNDHSIGSICISTLTAIFKLHLKKINAYFDLEIYSNFSSLLALCSCARWRFGYYRQSIGGRTGIYTHLMYFNIKAPVTRVYLQLALIAGCTRSVEQLLPISPSSSEKNTLDTMLQKNSIDINALFVILNPNASDLRIERRWGNHQFAELSSQLLHHNCNLTLIFIGSAPEREYVETIIKMVPKELQEQCCNLAGTLTLGSLIALLEKAHLIITNDSGPLHLAAAQQRPVLALFGPCTPEQYGSLPGVVSIYRNVYCSPCVHEFVVPPCGGNNACMQAISVEEVKSCAIKMLSNAPMPAYNPHPLIYYNDKSEHPLGIVSRGW
jgi:ADP-heptose:LPS heptosyltransferase